MIRTKLILVIIVSFIFSLTSFSMSSVKANASDLEEYYTINLGESFNYNSCWNISSKKHIFLQLFESNSTWRPVDVTKLKKSSKCPKNYRLASYSFYPTEPGVYMFREYFPGSKNHAPTVSDFIGLSVVDVNYILPSIDTKPSLGCSFNGHKLYGSVYFTNNVYSADVTVYVTSSMYSADLNVYLTASSYSANSCGMWYVTDSLFLADLVVYETSSLYTADLVVYETPYQFNAGLT